MLYFIFFTGPPKSSKYNCKVGRGHDKDLLSDDDDPKVIVELEQVGGRSVSKDKKVSTGGFYVDRLGDHKVAAAPAKWRTSGDTR